MMNRREKVEQNIIHCRLSLLTNLFATVFKKLCTLDKETRQVLTRGSGSGRYENGWGQG
jgi:hypothetical protein